MINLFILFFITILIAYVLIAVISFLFINFLFGRWFK